MSRLGGILNKIARGEIVGMEETMCFEILRFGTYEKCVIKDTPYYLRLAKAGFYYDSVSGFVCYCCGKSFSKWKATDDPLIIHRNVSPSCKFITANHEVNIPVQGKRMGGNKKFHPFLDCVFVESKTEYYFIISCIQLNILEVK